MLMKPSGLCQFQTKHDTRVDFDQLSVEVKYYSFEGNNLPWISLCELRTKVAHTLLMVSPSGTNLQRPANELRTGLLNGFLSGYCGFYVQIRNKNPFLRKEIIIYKSSIEFNGSGGLKALTAGLVMLMAFMTSF